MGTDEDSVAETNLNRYLSEVASATAHEPAPPAGKRPTAGRPRVHKVTFSLPPGEVAELRELAQRRGRTVTDLLRAAVSLSMADSGTDAVASASWAYSRLLPLAAPRYAEQFSPELSRLFNVADRIDAGAAGSLWELVAEARAAAADVIADAGLDPTKTLRETNAAVQADLKQMTRHGPQPVWSVPEVPLTAGQLDETNNLLRALLGVMQKPPKQRGVAEMLTLASLIVAVVTLAVMVAQGGL